MIIASLVFASAFLLIVDWRLSRAAMYYYQASKTALLASPKRDTIQSATTTLVLHSDNLQKHLCENLQLSRHLDSPTVDVWSPTSTDSGRNRVGELHIYQAIVLFIAQRHAHIAVTLNRIYPISILLAKKGPPSDVDRDIASAFFQTVAFASSSRGVLDFVFKMARDTVCRRREKVTRIDLDTLLEYLTKYTASGTIKEEFLNPRDLTVLKLQREHIRPQAMLRALITSLVSAPSFEAGSEQEADEIRDAIRHAAVLSRSTFYSYAFRDSCCSSTLLKFKRRVEKLAGYHYGAIFIYQMRMRAFPSDVPIIPHDWIHSDEPIPILSSPSPLSVAQRSRPTTTQESLLALNPNILTTWTTTQHTFLHPEIALIKHVYNLEHLSIQPYLPWIHKYNPRLHDAPLLQARPIASNKRNCYCCVAWVQMFNDTNKNATANLWELASDTGGLPVEDWQVSGIGDLDERMLERTEELVMWGLTRPPMSLQEEKEIGELDWGCADFGSNGNRW